MPLRPTPDRLVLAEAVTVEEVEALAEWLRATPGGTVDLSACTSLHTAAVQLLKVAGADVVGEPDDPWLAAHLPALLAPPASLSHDDPPTA